MNGCILPPKQGWNRTATSHHIEHNWVSLMQISQLTLSK